MGIWQNQCETAKANLMAVDKKIQAVNSELIKVADKYQEIQNEIDAVNNKIKTVSKNNLIKVQGEAVAGYEIICDKRKWQKDNKIEGNAFSNSQSKNIESIKVELVSIDIEINNIEKVKPDSGDPLLNLNFKKYLNELRNLTHQKVKIISDHAVSLKTLEGEFDLTILKFGEGVFKFLEIESPTQVNSRSNSGNHSANSNNNAENIPAPPAQAHSCCTIM